MSHGLKSSDIHYFVTQCNCIGHMYLKNPTVPVPDVYILVLHPLNSLDEAKLCMAKIDEILPVSLQFEYVIRLNRETYNREMTAECERASKEDFRIDLFA